MGAYPWWLPVLVTVMFGQFLVTSGRTGPPRYDPVGKYYGVVLYVALGVSLAVPDLALLQAVAVLIVGLSAVSLTSRVRALLTA